MSQKDINNIPEVLAQFDGKKYYMPSFYRINLGVFADFMDIRNIPFGFFPHSCMNIFIFCKTLPQCMV